MLLLPVTFERSGIAYSNSKLAILYYAHELQRRAPSGVDVVVFEPGFMPGTGLGREHRGGRNRRQLQPARPVGAALATRPACFSTGRISVRGRVITTRTAARQVCHASQRALERPAPRSVLMVFIVMRESTRAMAGSPISWVVSQRS